jgi:hypothetical protein
MVGDGQLSQAIHVQNWAGSVNSSVPRRKKK